jgi:putative endonuclease
MNEHKRLLGKQGEQIACDWIQTHGYQIVDRNWRCSLGELDIIASRDHLVLIIEVKTRISASLEPVYAKLDVRKREKLALLSEMYTQSYPWHGEWRVDGIAIALSPSNPSRYQLHHAENILDW